MEASWWTDPKELDPDQQGVVALAVDENHLVIGPPGCGKTNLLLLRASFLYKSGTSNIIILSFGRVLREFLATGSNYYPFSGDKIQTYIRWGIEVLRMNGMAFEESESFEETRKRLYEELSKVADQGKPENVHDVILLDEAQDYSADEVALISRFTERLFAVGDKDQQISDKKGALDKLIALGTTLTLLTTHYRNGLKICRVADGIKNLIDDPSGLEATSNYNEAKFPSSVDIFAGLNLDQQVHILIPRIENQLLAYPGEMIGVFCPRNADLDVACQILQKSMLADHLHIQRAGSYTAFSSDRLIVITSAIGSKGLEFRAVHMLAADKIKKFPTQRNLSYVSVTRTKTSLSIYHDESLAGYFEKGIMACKSKKPSTPTLDELFL